MEAATATAIPDWAALPEELVVIVMGSLEVPDLVRYGAVCSSCHAAYSTFRRLRLPSPRQPPCLLYSCDAHGPAAAALFCPSTGASFRIPLPGPLLADRSVVGASQGWLATFDELSNLHLLNPLTGSEVALPPITGLYHVDGFTNGKGNIKYRVYQDVMFSAVEARDRMCYQVFLSCSASAGRGCLVLLLHWPLGALSFARPGDEGWTVVLPDNIRCWGYRHAVYNEDDGLFYVLRFDGSVYSFDLHGPSPVERKIMREVTRIDEATTKYLVQAPWGDLLQVWRFVDYEGDEADSPLSTNKLQIFKVDRDEQSLVEVTSLGDHALFLGHNFSACLPIKDFPALKPDCAYLTDDHHQYVYIRNNCRRGTGRKNCRRGIGRWSIKRGRMEGLSDDAAPSQPWLDWPSPVWITPSFC